MMVARRTTQLKPSIWPTTTVMYSSLETHSLMVLWESSTIAEWTFWWPEERIFWIAWQNAAEVFRKCKIRLAFYMIKVKYFYALKMYQIFFFINSWSWFMDFRTPSEISKGEESTWTKMSSKQLKTWTRTETEMFLFFVKQVKFPQTVKKHTNVSCRLSSKASKCWRTQNHYRLGEPKR